MKRVMITDKLDSIDVPVSSLSLGMFDYIGEYTAKKSRNEGDQLFHNTGCFFRANYERGMLLYSLIKRFEIKSVLEIGFGRGYASFCMAKAMCDLGFEDGKVVTVDPNIHEDFLKQLTHVFPQAWFSKIMMMKGTSQEAFSKFENDQKFDLIYIDGDHRASSVRADWEASKERYTKFVLFDDYRLENDKKDIDVRSIVDEIQEDKEFIIMDRRIFFDDRGIADDDIDYGQVLITHPDFDTSEFVMDW